jgi:sorbitol-specific phosphotransferase system component IIC
MVKSSGEKKEGWFRIIVAIVSGIILHIWSMLIAVLAVINWLVTIISGKRNKELSSFCEYWNTETYKFVRYMTFVSNKRPFPFSNMERISKFER